MCASPQPQVALILHVVPTLTTTLMLCLLQVLTDIQTLAMAAFMDATPGPTGRVTSMLVQLQR